MTHGSTIFMTSPTASQPDEREGPSRQSSGESSGRFAPTVPPATESDSTRRLLFLDDDPVRAEAFLIENPRPSGCRQWPSASIGSAENWDEVHLDHDLGGKTFVDVNRDRLWHGSDSLALSRAAGTLAPRPVLHPYS